MNILTDKAFKVEFKHYQESDDPRYRGWVVHYTEMMSGAELIAQMAFKDKNERIDYSVPGGHYINESELIELMLDAMTRIKTH